MAWMMAGIFVSRSVQLGRVTSKLPGNAMCTSVMCRFVRFVANTNIGVCEWNGWRHLIDRSDRRDLNIFRIGLFMRDRCLSNDCLFRSTIYLSFVKLAGS
jgi:hypothetical protein